MTTEGSSNRSPDTSKSTPMRLRSSTKAANAKSTLSPTTPAASLLAGHSSSSTTAQPVPTPFDFLEGTSSSSSSAAPLRPFRPASRVHQQQDAAALKSRSASPSGSPASLLAPPPFYPARSSRDEEQPPTMADFASPAPPFWPRHPLAAQVKAEPEGDHDDFFALGDAKRRSKRSTAHLRSIAASDDAPSSSSSAMLSHGHTVGSSSVKLEPASSFTHDTVQGASLDASESSSSEGEEVSQSPASAAQTQQRPPRKRAARTYTPSERLHKQELDRNGKKRSRDQYRGAKEGILYQLAPRPGNAGSWETELAKRQEASKRAEEAREKGQPLRDFVSKDAKRPWKPPAVIITDVQHDDRATGSSSAGSSNLASQPPATSPSPTSAFDLPFANELQIAPVLGENSATNISVRASNGSTVLQRFSPTSSKKAQRLRDDAKAGAVLQKALFDASSARERLGGRLLHIGQSYEQQAQYGWTSDHLSAPAEADEMLRWVWALYHEHIAPLSSLLAADFRIALEMEREAGTAWMKTLLGEDQCGLLCKWWHTATLTQGYTPGERAERANKDPTILFGFEESFVLCLAHPEGFFKTVIRPGQVVIFRSSLPHQVVPLPDAPADASTRHWSVCLSVAANAVSLRAGDSMTARRHPSPPQPTEEQRKAFKRPRQARR